jgi:hypothetical protein
MAGTRNTHREMSKNFVEKPEKNRVFGRLGH